MSNPATSAVSSFAAALAAVVALAPHPASATRVVAHATAICQGALPAFETLVRKRPLAMQNEGDANAFVTCSFNNPGTNAGGSRISSITVYLQNAAAGTRTISCTAVNIAAGADAAAALYRTKSIPVPRDAGASTALQFTAADFPGAPILLPGDAVSVSCNLLPGTGITSTVLLNNAS
jgi:hypothetical protein